MNHVGFFFFFFFDFSESSYHLANFSRSPSLVMMHKLHLFAVDSSGSSNHTFLNAASAAIKGYRECHFFSYGTGSTKDGDMGAWLNWVFVSKCGFFPYFCPLNRDPKNSPPPAKTSKFVLPVDGSSVSPDGNPL